MSEIQRTLWKFDELPERPEIVEMIESRSFLPDKNTPKLNGGVTGARFLARLKDDEELCVEVCAALVAGLSVKMTAKRFGVSPRSIMAIKAAMTERGELAPVRLRIQRQLDTLIELGMETMIEGILSGEIHPGQIPIPILAAIDKKEQLAAGIVPGTERTRSEITADQLQADLAALRAAASLANEVAAHSDSQSVDSTPNTLDIKPTVVVDTALDTNPPAGPPVVAPFPPLPQPPLPQPPLPQPPLPQPPLPQPPRAEAEAAPPAVETRSPAGSQTPGGGSAVPAGGCPIPTDVDRKT